MPHLDIELNQNQQILLTPSNCTPEEWRRTVIFWSRGMIQGEIPATCVIEIFDFSQRMIWLRNEWKSSSSEHSFSISDAVKTSIKNARNEATEFDQLANFSEPPTMRPELPHLIRPLTGMQEENVHALLRMKNGANFSVPGAGKTATELTLWYQLRKQETVEGLMIVCPKSAFSAWLDEPQLLFASPPQSHVFTGAFIPSSVSIVIVNYEQLENSRKLATLSHWIKQNKAMLVLDEAHRVKAGTSAVRWRACRQLADVAKRTDLLTGTPMPQSYDDLRNLFSLSWKGIPPNHFSETRLRSLKRGGVFVRTTKTELGLPPMRTVAVDIEMGEIQRQIYDALRFSYAGDLLMTAGEEMHMAQRGKAIMTLLAAASNPGLMLGRTAEDSYLQMKWPPRNIQQNGRLLPTLESYVSHEIPSKYQWIIRFVQEAKENNRKVLVWSNFVGNLLALKRLLSPYSPALVYGSVSAEDRVSEISRFRNNPNCSVLLTNPQTLGEGISLHHECHDAIYLDRSYNAGLYLQSLDRIHRLGLDPEQETRVFLLQSIGTIDKRVQSRLTQKISNLARAMDDEGLPKASLPNEELEEDELFGMDSKDFEDLVNHLREP